MRWSSIVLAGYGAILASILAFEFRGLTKHGDSWPTITDITRRLIKEHRWFRYGLAVLLTWLPLHFYFPQLGI